MDPEFRPTAEQVAALPLGVARAWGLDEHVRSGPKPGLTLAAITRAAIDLADADGLEAASMARIASRLGYTTMSLYRYVGSKDELLVLLLDAVTEDALRDAPPVTAGDWRSALRGWAEQQLAVLLAHPWILSLRMPGPPMGPNSLAFVERGLQAMERLPLQPWERMAVIGLLSSYALSEARFSVDAADSTLGYGEQLRIIVDPARFPALHAVIASGQLDDMHPPPPGSIDDGTRFGVERILDGVEALVAPRLAPPEKPHRST